MIKRLVAGRLITQCCAPPNVHTSKARIENDTLWLNFDNDKTQSFPSFLDSSSIFLRIQKMSLPFHLSVIFKKKKASLVYWHLCMCYKMLRSIEHTSQILFETPSGGGHGGGGGGDGRGDAPPSGHLSFLVYEL